MNQQKPIIFTSFFRWLSVNLSNYDNKLSVHRHCRLPIEAWWWPQSEMLWICLLLHLMGLPYMKTHNFLSKISYSFLGQSCFISNKIFFIDSTLQISSHSLILTVLIDLASSQYSGDPLTFNHNRKVICSEKRKMITNRGWEDVRCGYGYEPWNHLTWGRISTSTFIVWKRKTFWFSKIIQAMPVTATHIKEKSPVDS